MSKDFNFLHEVSHRPWEISQKKWQYYQEWNDVLFLHFEVEFNDLKPLIPDNLPLDNYNGKHYVSVVAFKMEHIRPTGLPAINFISNFYEINVRTYVKKNNKEGVYFLSLEVDNKLSAFIARKLSGLPYEKAEIICEKNAYINLNTKSDCFLDVTFEIADKIQAKTRLEKWLTERYSLYLQKNKHLYIYEIHHKEWDLFQVNITKLDIHYNFKSLQIDTYKLISTQYSKGVQVVSWNSKKI